MSLTFKADDLENKLILETLNSILAIGDVPTLFSNDEVDGLLEVNTYILL